MEIYNRKLPTVKQLQYFIAVCEEGNFRKAAEKLSISQPPLSVQIKELEEKLGTNLFLRNTQQVTLTKEGEAFRSKAIELIKELCLITTSLKSGVTQKKVIGMTKTLSFDFIPKFKNFISNIKDDIVIYKNYYNSKELLIELKKGSIDFVVISDCLQEEKKIQRQLIHQESVILALPESHPASSQELLDFNDVLDLPLYWFNRYLNPSYYDQCEKVFKQLKYPLVRRAELPDTLSMLLNVSLGKGMLLLPASMTQACVPGVVYKKLTPYFESLFLIDIFLVWNDNALKNDLAITLINYFK